MRAVIRAFVRPGRLGQGAFQAVLAASPIRPYECLERLGTQLLSAIGNGQRLAEIQHNAAVDLAGLHPVEDAVDLLQWCRADFGVHLAVGGERNGLSEITPGADNAATHRNPPKNHVEDGRGEFAGGKADETDRAFPAHHFQRLREGGCGDRRHSTPCAPPPVAATTFSAAPSRFDLVVHALEQSV